MVLLQQAQNLEQAYRVLDPLLPLEGELLEAFYVPRPKHASIQPLITELNLDDSTHDKTLFTGYRGSGKTTELAHLEKELESSHLVIRMKVETQLNLGDVDFTDLLVIMGLSVFEQAQKVGVQLNDKKLDQLQNWYFEIISEMEKIPQKKKTKGFNINLKLISFSKEIETNPAHRQLIRTRVQANMADLLERLNQLIDDLSDKLNKRILIIVDGLDKMFDLEQVKNMFLHGANALLEPHCRIVYTVPLPLYFTNDFEQVRHSFHREFTLPNIKIVNKDHSPCQEGMDTLKSALKKRVNLSLFHEDSVDQLADLSGGLFREFISLARVSVLHAIENGKDKVENSDIDYAAQQVRNTYRRILNYEQLQELKKVDRTNEIENKPIYRELLHNLSVLEYNGSGVWWAVHPIVKPLLKDI